MFVALSLRGVRWGSRSEGESNFLVAAESVKEDESVMMADSDCLESKIW